MDKTLGVISFLDSIQIFYLAGELGNPDYYQTISTSLKKFIQCNNFNLLVEIDYFTLDDAEITSVNLVRNLQDGAPNIIYPAAFVDIITNKYHHLKNLKISVLNLEDIKKLKMGWFLSVKQGSVDEGKILIVEYNNDSTIFERTAFIGKGLTFDSGGYDLKPPSGMVNMRYDMSGGAAKRY